MKKVCDGCVILFYIFHELVHQIFYVLNILLIGERRAEFTLEVKETLVLCLCMLCDR